METECGLQIWVPDHNVDSVPVPIFEVQVFFWLPYLEVHILFRLQYFESQILFRLPFFEREVASKYLGKLKTLMSYFKKNHPSSSDKYPTLDTMHQ